jgi:transmembrane sensor
MSYGPAFEEHRRAEAAEWVVRLNGPVLDEADALAFDAWLSATPANAEAYDRALLVWQAYESCAPQVSEGLSARKSRPDRRGLFFGAGAAAAAAAAALAFLPQLQPATTQTYVTARGEHRTVELSDGSRIDLNAGTRLTVRMARDGRHVRLSGGQAVFDVTPDLRRPFEIAAGDRMVRVVGTQFDVRRRDGKLSVTVAEGAVEVRPAEGSSGRAYRLHPGQRLDHVEGAPAARVTAAEPAEVLAWRTGRLVYRGQPLSEVVADLNQQFTTPIRIEDPELAATPISGVLVLDDQDAVIRRLALLAPLTAVRSEAGLLLRR